ncbi:putative glycerol 3-phosphate permease [Monocercomonoides exilis]|uniref:putative glycerol 3-phosphate permease n=1 Tax=Monocercomonoides exilis TaxID=2049356 RepID=UPI003559DB3F|nr:putative glycerol 3-phosphate permease [Monocercomonoides exilis]|eukprot:MONOS_2004.1-p1 / transcript=MONOS_2004.1 / gene=MONOS_2004 / organism=Monocercomonoides_exilis_PA203 / gene_product=glycerol 3-phosphate permease / transcript_product=glycerol 3-phosphate permease / location=Mono_scaffold00038:168062-169783(+) / protein_length=547 / sequence_SO=supercontig / SO=protein_coding / is_pseudo=false
MAEAEAPWLGSVITVVVCAILVGACILDLTHNRKPPNKYPYKFILIRFANWITVGLTYACTYFGRYNMSLVNTPDSHDLLGLTKTQFGIVTTIRTLIYAVFVTVNGVIVDKIGGQAASIVGATGSGVANVITGIYLSYMKGKGVVNIVALTFFFSFNDYFQTFCTTAICKVGVNWYHLTERGLFSGIFGIVISFGLFLALQVNGMIKAGAHLSSVFFVPGVILSFFALLCVFFVKATPEDAGWPPVDDESIAEAAERQKRKDERRERREAEAASAFKDDSINTANGDSYNLSAGNGNKAGTNEEEEEEKVDYGMPLKELLRRLFCNPTFLLLCVVDFCVGWCRDGIIQNYGMYFKTDWLASESSVLYQMASTGITIGSMFGSLGAGVVSDYCCGSRRPPVAFAALVLYTGMILIAYFAKAGWVACLGISLTSFCFSCVHGIITSTCAMDLAGPRATATAVGILDGIQKIGSALTGVCMGALYDKYGARGWLTGLFPVSALGALLLIPILPKGKKKAAPGKEEMNKEEGKNVVEEQALTDETLPLIKE